jgi:hypothetical protein
MTVAYSVGCVNAVRGARRPGAGRETTNAGSLQNACSTPKSSAGSDVSPRRNAALGRTTTPAERAFFDDGGFAGGCFSEMMQQQAQGKNLAKSMISPRDRKE